MRMAKKNGFYNAYNYNGTLRVTCKYKNDLIFGKYKIFSK